MKWIALLFDLTILLFLGLVVNGQKVKRTTLLFQDEFTSYDSSTWVTEMAPLPNSRVYVQDGHLVLDTRGGVTVWFGIPLQGNVRVEYKRMVVVDSGTNDRLSDLNTFFMASDPRWKFLFTRNGVLESYDSLLLYYVGMGGNTNKTTRFRKYKGNGNRRLIQEYTDSAHLLQANRWYQVAIEVKDGWIRYWVDGVLFFEYRDEEVLKEGYFGFRSTWSRQWVDEVKVYQLE